MRTRQPEAAGPRRGRGGRLALAAAALLLASLGGAPAQAARPSLPSSVSSAHFVVHYDTATYPAATAQAVAGYAEEGYTHLVTGGGASPNAGLRTPIDDGDHKTDVYLTTWSDVPSYVGGITLADGTAPYASWYILTPGLSLSSLRFRAVHEFLHVLQQAYQPNPAAAVGGMWTESTANWAVEWSLPDVDPGDSNFYDDPNLPAPWLPLDCSYGTWPASGGRPCGNGYWQWLFIERQVEDYGVDFVSGLLERVKACVSACSSTSTNTAMLDAEIKAQSANAATLASQFGRYAWTVWDPSRWTSTAVATMHAQIGRPPASSWDRSNLSTSGYAGDPASTIDHLATRYVLVRNANGTTTGGPDDALDFQLTRPGGEPATWTYLTRAKGTSSWVSHGTSATTGSIPFDPAVTREVLVPLTNTTLADGESWTYGLRLTRGTPTPPANDQQTGALAATLDTPAQTDTVYAGGRGDLEAGSCGTTDMNGVRNGVWFRALAPNAGQYRFDATSSAIKPVIVLRTHGTTTFRGCSSVNGSFTTTLSAGDDLDVYVGRQAADTGDGTLARLLLSGPPSSTAPPTIAGTAQDGDTLTESGLGTWTGSPTSTARQWMRCDAGGTGCAVVTGATGAAHTLISGDVGHTMRLRISRSNGYGTGTANSAATAVIAARAPVSTAVPAISGTATEGATLTAGNGTWTGTTPMTFTRRWERCTGATCTAVPGAGGTTYVVIAGDVGTRLRTVVTAQNAAGSADATSAMTAVVTAAPQTPPTSTPTTTTTTPKVTPALPGAVPVPRSVALRGKGLTADRRGRIAVRLRCAAGDRCPVRVTLRATVKRGGRRLVTTLGTGRATLLRGRTSTVTVRLGAGGRRLVTRARRLAATVQVRVTQADGSVRTTSAAVTVRASG